MILRNEYHNAQSACARQTRYLWYLRMAQKDRLKLPENIDSRKQCDSVVVTHLGVLSWGTPDRHFSLPAFPSKCSENQYEIFVAPRI